MMHKTTSHNNEQNHYPTADGEAVDQQQQRAQAQNKQRKATEEQHQQQNEVRVWCDGW
jgi:hypothetical protein